MARAAKRAAPKQDQMEHSAEAAEQSVASQNGIGYLVRQAHRAFVRVLADRLASHDITPAQWTALRVLWREDGYSQVELAQRMNVEKASLTSVLDALETRGLVERVRSSEDRRKSNVHLTVVGRALETVLLPYAESINTQATRNITKQDLATFTRVLLQVTGNLQ